MKVGTEEILPQNKKKLNLCIMFSWGHQKCLEMSKMKDFEPITLELWPKRHFLNFSFFYRLLKSCMVKATWIYW